MARATADEKIEVTRRGIENGSIRTFAEIFLYANIGDTAERLGVKPARLSALIEDPSPLRYTETYALAKIFKVPAAKISELIHNQLDAPKQSTRRSK